MKDIYHVEHLVKKTLAEKPSLRNSDNKLYMEICMMLNPDVQYMGFLHVFNNQKELGIPKMETVRRARQKIQHDYPELRAADNVTDGRYENWKIMREYALDE